MALREWDLAFHLMAPIFIVFADEVGHTLFQITKFGYPRFSYSSTWAILCCVNLIASSLDGSHRKYMRVTQNAASPAQLPFAGIGGH